MDDPDGPAAEVATFNVFPSSTKIVRNALEARETDEAETLTAMSGNRRPDRGTMVACVHPDAVARDGVARSGSPDAEGRMRKRDAGLGIIDDGSSYSLTTGAPPAVGGTVVAGGASCPIDPQPDGPRYAAVGDACTVNVIEWIGQRLARVAVRDRP